MKFNYFLTLLKYYMHIEKCISNCVAQYIVRILTYPCIQHPD